MIVLLLAFLWHCYEDEFEGEIAAPTEAFNEEESNGGIVVLVEKRKRKASLEFEKKRDQMMSSSGDEDQIEAGIASSGKNRKRKATIYHDYEKKDQASKRKVLTGEDALMCHQCQRNDKGAVVRCMACKRKRYCYPCMKRWCMFISDLGGALKKFLIPLC